jgi:uncharacterized protein YfaP (DUF2135 family)
MSEESVLARDLSRRDLVRRGAVAGGAVVWAVPMVQTVGMAAAAGTPLPPETPPDTGTVTGRVVDARTGAAIGFATVAVTGTGRVDSTDANGEFEITDVPVGTWTVTASATGYTTDAAVVVVTATATSVQNFALVAVGNDVTVVLTWGELPADLDLHLSGPDGAGNRFHVAYYNIAPVAHASLDLDDVTSFGPETVTITVKPDGNGRFVAGDYHAWVHNYSRTPEFNVSDARVSFTGKTAQIAEYLVVNASGDPAKDIWLVVNFTLDEDGNVISVAPQQRLVDGDQNSVF